MWQGSGGGQCRESDVIVTAGKGLESGHILTHPAKITQTGTQKTLFGQLVVMLFRKTKGFTCGSPGPRIKGYFGFLQEQGDSLGMLRMVSVNLRLTSRQQ